MEQQKRPVLSERILLRLFVQASRLVQKLSQGTERVARMAAQKGREANVVEVEETIPLAFAMLPGGKTIRPG